MSNLPVPIPRTSSVSEVETGAYGNSIRDALNFGLNPPIGAFYQNTIQSVANTTWTGVTFDSTTADYYGGHSNTTLNSRYTAVVPGLYVVDGGGTWTTNASGSRGTSVYKNGSPLNYGTSVVGTSNVIQGTTISGVPVYLNVGDYVELFIWQNSGGALSTVAPPQYGSWMTVQWRHT